MVSEMESVKNVANSSVNNSAYIPNSNPQPVHSPQSVGIEFVRQYYTMLNRAPNLLFRFYSDDSTFVHGCLDKHGETVQYVRGQKAINNKIMSLNFKNCHTKIRQVDSMETIGNGVVIQVIGELSNNGQPLRRFLQTFVLTPQSPNKYYVRNDIFRYQEEFYLEENDDLVEKNDIESKLENNVEIEPVQPVEPIVEKEYSYQQNGSVTNAIEELVPSVEESVANQEEPESIQESSIEVNTSLIDVTEPKEPLGEEEDIESVSDSASNANQLFNEPKTYASMLSKNFQSGPTASINLSKPAPVNLSVTNVVINVNNDAANPAENSVQPNANNKNAGFPQRDRFSKKGGFNRRNESRESVKNNDSDNNDGDGEVQSNSGAKKFPDDHQLFIGNLLPNFAEDDLLNIFARYGKILEVRINRQSHKTNANKANRNYGFITFEDANVVDQIIAQKPIYHGNHRYNVEKKQGKSGNYERNRNNQNNSPRNGSQSNPLNLPPRHLQVNSGGQGNPGQRSRAGQNYNSANNAGNRNFSGGQNYNNRNAFNNHQQNR